MAQDAAAPAAPAAAGAAATQAPAYIIYDDGNKDDAFIVAATKTQIRYKTTPQAVDTEDMNISDCQVIYLLEPPIYRQAMEQYQGRKYAEAKENFAKCKVMFKPTTALDNNYSTLAAFYELECLRRLSDLEGLSKALEGFRKDGLTRDHHLRQLELYVLWDAVRTKSWDRVIAVGDDRIKEKLPSYQRAQVAYCMGLAYEALKQENKALNSFNAALVADAGATEEIAEQAAQGIMRIHLANEEVKLAMKLWGTEDENKFSTGYLNLQEAGAIAALYELTFGNGKKLPPAQALLLKYKPAVNKPEASKEAAKPAAPEKK
jgi:hypothetical protein